MEVYLMSKKILKFSRPGCVPCSFVTNYLNDKGIEYTEINVYDDTETANKFNIQSVPVVVLLDGDDVEDMIFGYQPEQLNELISKL
jgi:glutaredoxin